MKYNSCSFQLFVLILQLILKNQNINTMKLIADSGSTKTDWAMIAPDGTIVGTYKSDGINPIHQSPDEIKSILNKLVQWSYEIDEIHFYGSGLRPEKQIPMQELLSSYFHIDITKVEAQSDLLGAARALCGNKEGIACILGTGANSCLYNGEKIIKNTPALGYILGDEGSGAVLGKRLINGIYKGGLPIELKKIFEEELHLTLADIIEHVYRSKLPNRWLASLSSFIYKYKDNYPELSQMVVGCLHDFICRNILPYQRKDLPISAVGSIAWYYQTELAQATSLEGMCMGKIIKNPINGLIDYHSHY